MRDTGFIDPFAIPPDPDSLRRADSLRALLPDSLRDSLRAVHPDSVRFEQIDTTWVVYTDSSARIRQSGYRPRDPLLAGIYQHQPAGFFLRNKSPAFRRDVLIDSAGSTVTVTERVNTLDVRMPMTVSMDDYIRMRFAEDRKRNWRTMMAATSARAQGDRLGSLLGSITNIEIPVPQNPLFSIFGGRGIKLNVSGAVDIRAGLKTTTSDRVTASALDQTRSEPNFNQDVRVNVNGLIGDKLNVLADWNTQRTFEFENQLKLKYTGYEDEIIKTIEAGNVSLSTPPLVSGGQALFGLKANLQVGPLGLTALLSQKKGQTKELAISGGAEEREVIITPDKYSKSYYFVDLRYRDYWDDLHAAEVTDITSGIQENEILQIDVWRSTLDNSSQTQQLARDGFAHIELGERPPAGYAPDIDVQLGDTLEEVSFSGRFIKLEPEKDYRVDTRAGVIRVSSVQINEVLAVSYVTVDGSIYGGDTTSSGKLILKMVKPKNVWDRPDYEIGWNLLLKNIYPLQGRDLKREGFTMKVFRGTAGAAEEDQILDVPLLQVLGLDRYNENNDRSADNNFDFIPNVTIDAENAELIFPTLRPFDSTIVQYFRAQEPPVEVTEDLLFSDVYDTTAKAAGDNTVNNRYFLKGLIVLGQRSKLNLGFNIVEGSVQVLLNGSALTPNVDYTVDYIVGEVVIKNEAALLPGANVQVKFEQNDLFQVASKTLVGARGELDVIENTKMGFTMMNLTQETLSDKVRLGEEPTDNLIFGADASSQFDMPILTGLVNLLPGIRTGEISNMRFNAEAAYMLPNPNTKTSPIVPDEGAAIAVIDDFEGSRRTIPFPISFGAWNPASVPVAHTGGLGSLPDSVKNWARGRMLWYNVLPSDVTIDEIWPNRQYRSGESQVTVLNLEFAPLRRGMYNFSPNVDSSLHRATPDLVRQNWNGVMRYIASSAGNILEQNMNFLEIWLKAEAVAPEDLRYGRLRVSLGRLSEDALPNRRMNSEDEIRGLSNPTGFPNGILNPEEEDFGLDTLSNANEQIAFAAFLASNAGDPDVDPADPSGDDWFYVSGSPDYGKINGMEGNGVSVDGRLPDTEDLDVNGVADLFNEYAEYILPLDTLYYDDNGVLVENRLIGGGGGTNEGWYQYRIPLLAPDTIIGSARSVVDILQNVQSVRLWLTGFTDSVSVRIAEMGLVGNQWQERLKNDSTFKISIVNIEDNPEYANSPGYADLGIQREKDRTQPDKIIEGNEQSLALVLNQLLPGDSRQAVRFYGTSRPMDVFNYGTMRLFVYGDPELLDPGTGDPEAEFFIRFGRDTLNYYEYRAPLQAYWDSANWVNISFAELTALKSSRDTGAVTRLLLGAPYPPGASYAVRGEPSLRQITELVVGVTNPVRPGSPGRPLSGQVWVNELRLVNVDDSPGLAYKFDSQIKLANIGNVSVNFARTDPTFHSLSERFGTQVTNSSWAVTGGLKMEEFLPASWKGTALPFNYSHRETMAKPKYLPNTDIVVTEAAQLADTDVHQDTLPPETGAQVIARSQTLTVSNSYAAPTIRFMLPVAHWLVTETINKLSFGFNYNDGTFRNPSTSAKTTWGWNGSVGYTTTLPPDLFVSPFDNFLGDFILFTGLKKAKIFYMPITRISGGVTGQRGRIYEEPRTGGAIPRDTRTMSATRNLTFGWRLTENAFINLSGDYSLRTDRNLSEYDNDSVGRSVGDILTSMFFRGPDRRYAQGFRLNTKPTPPDILGIKQFLTFGFGYNSNYAWQNAFQQGDIGKSAGVNNSINISMNLRLKELTDPWFSDGPQQPQPPRTPPRGGAAPGADTTKKGDEEPSSGGGSPLKPLRDLLKFFVKIPFLDFQNIGFNFTQGNRMQNSGVVGSTGFLNFWGRLPFAGPLLENGPSRLYQLGILTDPSGDLSIGTKSTFPFIKFNTTTGIRAAGGALEDILNQTNQFTIKTDRALWQGARLDLNWKFGWAYNRVEKFSTNEFGIRAAPPVTTSSGNVDRSYLTFPPVLFFKVFNSNLENVGKKYEEYRTQMAPEEALAKAFEEGLEALPFLGKIFGTALPRVNWGLRWDGIQGLFGLTSVVEQLSLEHAYSSDFRRDFRNIPGLGEVTDIERVTYGFAPLLGATARFRQFLKGNMTASVRFGSNNSYNLNLAANNRNIVEDITQDISVTLNYSRTGFSFPLFGLNLSNDLNVGITFSLAKKSQKLHIPDLLTSNQEGTGIGGSTRTTLEPRIRYVLSSRVSAALYYRYISIAPDAQGSSIVGTTSTEAGLDIHISI